MKIIRFMAVALLAGCTAIQSVPIDSAQDTSQGPTYFLPTTAILLVVSLSGSRDQIEVAASQPEYIPDLAHGYSLNAVWSPFNSDDYEIKANTDGLLTSIDMKSQGRLDEALVNLSKSFGAIFLETNVTQQQRIPVFQDRVDIANLAEDPAALASLNEAINRAIAGANFKTSGEAADLQGLRANPKAVTISVERLSLPVGNPITSGSPNCDVGVCYRRLIPYELTASFANGSQFSSLIRVPNGSPTYAAAIRRGALTDWDTLVTLSNGVVTEYKAKNGAEAEQLFLLPFELVGGAIEGITKKGELFTAQTTRDQAELDLIAKRRELQKAQQPTLESALLDSSAALFSFKVGAQNAGGSSVLPRIRIGAQRQILETNLGIAKNEPTPNAEPTLPEISGPPPELKLEK